LTPAADPPGPPELDLLALDAVALDPDSVAATVLAVPGVAGLHPGSYAEVASFLPGRRVVGVRCDGRTVEVHVALRWGDPVPATAEAIRRALTALGASTVDVVVEDLVEDLVEDVVTADQPLAAPGGAPSEFGLP
jgi:uncharacterized alkaline shock family protein YloU